MSKKNKRKTAFRYREELKHRATFPEKKIKKILRELNIKFRFQWVFFGKKRFVIADFYLPDFKVVLEIDGKSHEDDNAKIYDEYRTKFLINRCGVSEVVRLKNSDILRDREKVKQTLADMFGQIEEDVYSKAYFATG